MRRTADTGSAIAIIALVYSIGLVAEPGIIHRVERAGPLRVAGGFGDFWRAFRKDVESVYESAAEGLGLDRPDNAGGGQRQGPARTGLDRGQIRELQERLRTAGFDPGPVDGVAGPKTSRAITRYQEANGLPADGVPSEPLLDHLRTGRQGRQPSAAVTAGARPNAAGHSIQPDAPLEKWLSPQGVFSVYRPKSWTVSERYTGATAGITVTDPAKRSGVVFEATRNTGQTTDCLYRMGEVMARLAERYPDAGFTNARATGDRSRAVTDVSYKDHGDPVAGRYYCTGSAESVLVMGFHAPEAQLTTHRPLLLTILNNINFYDPAPAARAQPAAADTGPVQTGLVWREAADGSSRFLAPPHWDYQAVQGKVLLGSEKEDAGFLFTSLEVSSKFQAPGMLFSAYRRPRDFIRFFLARFGATAIQVLEARRDTDPSIQQFALATGRQYEGEELTVRYRTKGGRVCLGAFKLINGAPSPLTGIWYSIVSGFWAPEAGFTAYAPVLLKIGESFQINQQYAGDYIRSGLANLRRLQQKTRESIRDLHQARHEQQRAWEANQARKDYSNRKFSQYMRGETDWVSELEGGTVYHTDSWGTKDTATGDTFEGRPYDTVHFEGENPRHPSLETMTEIDSFELYRKYIRGSGN